MECHNCSLASICKIYDMTKSASLHMNIEIRNCKIRQLSAGEKELSPTQPVKKQRTPEELSEVSEKIRKIQGEKGHRDFSVVKKEKSEEVKEEECPSCKTLVLANSFDNCDICNATGCPECITSDINTGQKHCPMCWSNQLY